MTGGAPGPGGTPPPGSTPAAETPGTPEGQAGPAPAVLLRAAGDEALLAEVAGAAEATALYRWLRDRQEAGELPEVAEIVPAARTVLLDGVRESAALAAVLHGYRPTAGEHAAGPLTEVPVRYDGADLAEVAGLWGVSPEAAVRIHTAPEYLVAFCGFAPGFGYLTGLPERYHVPRRATPRTTVPAGSVALAGPYTGVYPRSSPGGWQLLGRTDLVLWDTGRQPAALLSPGGRVRFTAVRG